MVTDDDQAEDWLELTGVSQPLTGVHLASPLHYSGHQSRCLKFNFFNDLSVQELMCIDCGKGIPGLDANIL